MVKEATNFEDDPFKMIRNNFNFTFVCEFLHHFYSAFFNGPEDVIPTTPFMEHLLLYQDDAKKINQFFIKLLKPLPGWRLVSQENWFESLAKEYKKRDLEVDFPLPATVSTILTIPLLQRLSILRNLCEFHLEQPEHFWELLRGVKDGETDWRIEPIGKDSQNRRYWLFSDGRLYREIEGESGGRLTKKKAEEAISWDIEDETNWELVCLTRSDYDEFLTSFTPVKAKDKSFLKMIREEIIPHVEPILQYQLGQHRKYFRPVAAEKVFLLPRKRSSRLLEKELEDEKRRLEEEAAAKEAEKERQALRRSLLAERADLIPKQKSKEELEKDLALEREQRAEMRRLKKEKELQIKAIEEAFYSTYNPDETNDENSESADIDTENESDNELEIVEDSVPPKSPIKLVLKMTKPAVEIEKIDIINADENLDIIDEITEEQVETTVEIENLVNNTDTMEMDNTNDKADTMDIAFISADYTETQPVLITEPPVVEASDLFTATSTNNTEMTASDITPETSTVAGDDFINISAEDVDLLKYLSNNQN